MLRIASIFGPTRLPLVGAEEVSNLPSEGGVFVLLLLFQFPSSFCGLVLVLFVMCLLYLMRRDEIFVSSLLHRLAHPEGSPMLQQAWRMVECRLSWFNNLFIYLFIYFFFGLCYGRVVSSLGYASLWRSLSGCGRYLC